MSENQDKRLEALQKMVELDEELGLYDKIKSSCPEDREIDGLKLVCTCGACPEQYDVYNTEGTRVGYLRLRHGWFRADVPSAGGETVHESYPMGDGTFNDEEERVAHLTEAVKKIKAWWDKTLTK